MAPSHVPALARARTNSISSLRALLLLLALFASAHVAASAATYTTADCTAAAGDGIQDSDADSLDGPWGVTVESSGSILVADLNNNRVMRWQEGATSGTRVAGNDLAATDPGALYNPIRVVVGSDGRLVVSEYTGNRVSIWQPGSLTRDELWVAAVAQPLGLALDDGSGNLLLTSAASAYVQRFVPGSGSGVNWYGDGTQNWHDVKLGSDGLGYVLDRNFGVDRFPATQSLAAGARIAGAAQGSGANQMYEPKGIALDASLGIWVADRGNNRVLSVVSIDLSYVLSQASPEVSDLDEPILFRLPGANYSEGLRCAFWHETAQRWLFDGVDARQGLLPGQPLQCETRHLTFFAGVQEIKQGFVQTWACAQVKLLSSAAVLNVFSDASWPLRRGACLCWSILATLLLASAMACRVDFVRDRYNLWRDEFFLVEVGDNEPEVSASGLGVSSCCECSALREALDEIISGWFEYWSQLRNSCEIIWEVLRESLGSDSAGSTSRCSSGSGSALASSGSGARLLELHHRTHHRILGTLVLASSRRLVAASLGMSNATVTFVLEDEDLASFLVETHVSDDLVGTRSDNWRTSEHQTMAWTSLHDTVGHHLLLHAERHTACGLPQLILKCFLCHNPVGALFLCDLFHSCKKRVLLLAVDLLGAMALSCVFFDAASMVRGKPSRSNVECNTRDKSTLWMVGRIAAIANGALLVAGLPLAFIDSLRTKGFRRIEKRGSAAWRRQLRVWAVQDKLLWALALLYLALCLSFILIFLASIGPEDHANWTTVLLLAFTEDLVFLPALVAVCVPGMTTALLGSSARVLRTDRRQVVRKTQEELMTRTNLLLPIQRA